MIKGFIGLDTEWIKGYARLICLSDGRIFKIKNKEDVIKFFERFSKERFIAFNADADIQALLKYFPFKVWDKLMMSISTAYGKHYMFYVKDKFLGFKSNHIFDCYQFFHTSLAKASKKFLNKKKLEVDSENLTEKSIYSKETIDYCIRDAKLCLELFNYFRESLPEEVKNCRPFSQASYSEDFCRNEIKSCQRSKELNNNFRKGYKGGRFEMLQRGHFKNVYSYDINSAYPYELCRLKAVSPSARAKINAGYIPEADYAVYRVKLSIPQEFLLPLPHKLDIRLVYPYGEFEAYITKGEFELLHKYIEKIYSGFHFFIEDDCQTDFLFKEKMEWLYSQKKISKNKEAYKILLNGLYGKLCQRVLRWVTLKQFNSLRVQDKGKETDNYTDWEGREYIQYEDVHKSRFIYASEITAECRLRMYGASQTNLNSIIAIQTDSIISKDKLDVSLSDKMGDWHVEEWNELYMIGCGVYFYRKGNKWYRKQRGFQLEGSVVKSQMEELFNSDDTRIGTEVKSKLSLRQARIRHLEWQANIIGKEERFIDINMDRKRVWERAWVSGKDMVGKNMRSTPIKIIENKA